MTGFTFYEFFAGGGMVRAGLGEGWTCLFANDVDPMKVRVYAENWGAEPMLCEDVAALSTSVLPGAADLAWASFPCQDLSLAGDYRGLGRQDGGETTRSGTFWPFWRLVEGLRREGRNPAVIVLENVLGALTANSGRDFCAICGVLARGGYSLGAVVMDARWFLPQSRPRLFVVALDDGVSPPSALSADEPSERWTTPMLRAAHGKLDPFVRAAWKWWRIPQPDGLAARFEDLLEDEPVGVAWHDGAETRRLLGMMSPVNLRKVERAKAAGGRVVGALYRRTRTDPDGRRSVRAEVRFDGLAGCLRTPAGGSSRQKLLVVEGEKVRSRLLSPREAARLMGLPDTYRLPRRYSDAYHVAGDGVAVPVVRALASSLLEPLARAAKTSAAIAVE